MPNAQSQSSFRTLLHYLFPEHILFASFPLPLCKALMPLCKALMPLCKALPLCRALFKALVLNPMPEPTIPIHPEEIGFSPVSAADPATDSPPTPLRLAQPLHIQFVQLAPGSSLFQPWQQWTYWLSLYCGGSRPIKGSSSEYLDPSCLWTRFKPHVPKQSFHQQACDHVMHLVLLHGADMR